MAFVTEKISEEDKARIEPVINHDKIEELNVCSLYEYGMPIKAAK
jgi:hypothetical protein